MFPRLIGRRQRAFSLHRFAGIVCFFLMGCEGCEEAKREREAKTAAQEFLQRMNDSPSEEDKQNWGQNKFFLFGPPLLWKNDITTDIQNFHPLTYRATATVWYRGTTPPVNQSIEAQRTIFMNVQLEEGAGWRVSNYELTNAVPLSGWRQLGYWIWWSYAAPIGIYLLIVANCPGMNTKEFFALFSILFVIGAIVWSGIVSYYTFGHGFAIVCFIPIYIVVPLILIGLALANKSKRV